MRYALLILFIAAAPFLGEDKAKFYQPIPVAVSSLGAIESDGYLHVYGGHAERTHTFDTKSVLGTFHRLKLDGGTKWEGPLTSSTRVQLLSDDGGEEFSEDGTTSKDLTKPDFKKSHSEWGTSSSRG